MVFFFLYANSMTRHSNDVKSAVALDLLFFFCLYFVFFTFAHVGRTCRIIFTAVNWDPTMTGGCHRDEFTNIAAERQHTICIISWAKRAKSRVLGNPRARII